MRKFLTVILALILIISPFTAFAEGDIGIEAESVILIDASTGRILYSDNCDERLPIASVTKIMTLDLIFESIEAGTLNITDKIKISDEASGMGGSQAFIDSGGEYTADDLIKSIIMASANDSAVAMAERLAGSEDAFVIKMNNKAKELNMENTCFKNCTGLPEEGHYSTASDVAKMSMDLIRHERYFDYSTLWTDSIYHEKDGRSTELVNTNKLIRSLSGCDGIKTGSTSEAKFCVSTTAKRGDMRLISVVLGGETSKSRFNDASKLINYGFAQYGYTSVCALNESIATVNIYGGVDKAFNVVAGRACRLCLKNDGSDKVETVIDLPEIVDAPVVQSEPVGKLTVFLNGEVVDEIELYPDGNYRKATITDKIKSFFGIFGK